MKIILSQGNVGFEILTAVTVNSSIFWDTTPCSLLKINRHFGDYMFLRNVVEFLRSIRRYMSGDRTF
jgi:hypothetical protein